MGKFVLTNFFFFFILGLNSMPCLCQAWHLPVAPKGRFNADTGLSKDKMVLISPHGDRVTYLSNCLIR